MIYDIVFNNQTSVWQKSTIDQIYLLCNPWMGNDVENKLANHKSN